MGLLILFLLTSSQFPVGWFEYEIIDWIAMKRYLIFLFSLFLMGKAISQEVVRVGDRVPLFAAVSDEDKVWSLKEYLGKKNVVLYFYPAAMTGGCTSQACGYRDHQCELKDLDAIVIGISGDDVASLQIFKRAKNLNFTLLSDDDGAVARLFGVPVSAGGQISRMVEGMDVVLNRGVTAQRWTFIIGKDGRIKYINQQVDAASDYKTVMEVLAKTK